MKLKLTLQRGGRPSADLMVSIDATAPIAELAQYLAKSDPESHDQGADLVGLEMSWPRREPLSQEAPVGDSGLRSGATVTLVRKGNESSASPSRPTVAVVSVVAGPDAGKEFPICAGTSTVGRGRDCDVRLTDPMTSRRHARIHVGEAVEIHDLGSVNGVIVGDSPVESATLRPGDTVRLGDSTISVVMTGGGGGFDASDGTFNRPPRLVPRYGGRTFSLPDPPPSSKGQRFPLIPLFAPLLMGSALYLSTKSTTSLIFMAMSPLMMVGNVVEGQTAGKRRFRNEIEKFREEADRIHAEVVADFFLEGTQRRAEYPSLDECIDGIKRQTANLWSRRPDAQGFGHIRLGLGRQPSRSKVVFPAGRQLDGASIENLHERFDAFSVIDGVPVVTELDQGAFGVAGPPSAARELARSYVLQLAALHSPGEMALYSLCGAHRAADWEWIKWLPHCGSPQSPIECNPLAASQSGYNALIGELEAVLRSRAEMGRPTDGNALPRLLLLLDEPPVSERSRLVELSELGPALGLWVVWVATNPSALPACCVTYVALDEKGNASASFVDSASKVEPLEVDRLTGDIAEDLARRMSPIVDASSKVDSQSEIPRSVSLLTLVGRDVADSADRVIERWGENRSLLTGPRAVQGPAHGRPGNLRAVIGESAVGPHVLDLKTHGPHALVGGTTGAGKSEMLQSWIIGMALSNSPQRLTFLLVDYKGGSAFSDCVHLPHTVGLVTDLSPHLVRRALISLSAELRYREHVLQKKRAKDLAALEREGDPEAPPSLVIVVDEFAALVQEVPEFVDGVVNVAQRGRSLGLHLILATQRPSGVIRENLRANTNLRIALRMADAADSSDVIGTKVAATFDPAIPGRAASRTGPTALVPFQTGYVGGWTSDVPERPEIGVCTLGFSPKVSWDLPLDNSAQHAASGPTDIQKLVSAIREANHLAELSSPRRPWLAELASAYDLAKLPSRRRDDELVFAVADDPANQQQPTIAFKPDDDGNMAIFGTGNSGKSTLLRTLCLAAGLTIRGGPCHVYGIDFGARGLQMLEQLPHVGGIIAGSDVERVSRLFSMLRSAIDQRAADYSTLGAGSITQYRKISEDTNHPRILLLVDGMGGMRTTYEGTEHHRLFESFLAIAADGRQVGIHVIIAADRAGAVPSALGALIQRRVVLRLAGDNDYAMLGQANDVLTAKSPPGRALCDGLEVQVAILGGSPDVLVQDTAVKAFASAMRNSQASIAPSVPMLRDEIPLDELVAEVDSKPTFAVSSESLAPVGIATEGTFTLGGPPGSGRTTALLTVVRSFRRWEPDLRTAYFGSRRSAVAGCIEWDKCAFGPSEAAKTAPEVAEMLREAEMDGSRGLVVIENLPEFVQTEADSALQDMVKSVTACGHLVISDGEPMPLSGLQPLLQLARASRVGLVLQPEQSDGTLFRAQFPRLRKTDFPPGRGLYVAKGAQPAVVQVAVSGSATH